MQGYTWNPVTGCPLPLISAGCKNCYARKLAEGRLRGRFGYPQDDPFQIIFHKDRLKQPLKMKKPARIFVGSMGDIFHEKVTDWHLLQKIYPIMRKTPQHTYMILSKRYKRMLEYKKNVKGFPNVYYGVSICDMKDWDKYAKTEGGFMDFISIEPLLQKMVWGMCVHQWVIVGGESGINARSLNANWARYIRDECKQHNTPFFMKQMSGTGRHLHDIPKDLRIREYPEW